jgi:hypothetical protein
VISVDTEVTPKMIHNYFGDIPIQHIIIDDDKQNQLVGNVNGTICSSPMPTLGWKNYWYGKYRLINYVKEHELPDEPVINCRFDIFCNSNHFCFDHIKCFLSKKNKIERNYFIHDGIASDNFYVGTVDSLHHLINYFHFHLDDICQKYAFIGNQEKLVFMINEDILHKRIL